MPSKLFACFTCSAGKAESDELTILDYCHSSLSDVPPDVFLSERTLEELYLDSNRLCELPRQLFLCHGLKVLWMSDNDLQNVPPAISSLTNLTSLDLSKNNISDIPDSIKNCKQLEIVNASTNQLRRLPEGFTRLLSLKELYLNDTFLVLELRENQLNTLPKSLARLTLLERLDIGQNDFSELPEIVGSLPNLTELWADNNRIKGIPAFIGMLKKLSFLDASKNKIDYISSEIEKCTSLTDLRLSSNNLKELPEALGNCRFLKSFHLNDNLLTALPDSIGKLTFLEELVMTQNVLEYLPASVGLLRALHTLHLDDNFLTELPPELGSCLQLRIFTVSCNRLPYLPPELGHLTNLLVLNVCGNLIENLPVSFSSLELKALWLSENQTKPNVQLHSETDSSSGQKVLTCFMLPQLPRPESPEVCQNNEDDDFLPGPAWEKEHQAKSMIKFAFDIDLDKPGHLTRAPTPYPKELKALAKHSRNLRSIHKDAKQLALYKNSEEPMEDEKNGDSDEQTGNVLRAYLARTKFSDTSVKLANKLPLSELALQDSHNGECVSENKQTIDCELCVEVVNISEVEKPILKEARTVKNNSSLVIPKSMECPEVNTMLKENLTTKTPVPNNAEIAASEVSDAKQITETTSSNSSASMDSGFCTEKTNLGTDEKTRVAIAVEQKIRPSSLNETEFVRNSSIERPGSLAVAEPLSTAHFISRASGLQQNRPNSLAAPINTIGIPPPPLRAASHMILNSTTSNTVVQNGNNEILSDNIDSLPVKRFSDSWKNSSKETKQDKTLPSQSSSGLVSIIGQMNTGIFEEEQCEKIEEHRELCNTEKAIKDELTKNCPSLSELPVAKDLIENFSTKAQSRIPVVNADVTDKDETMKSIKSNFNDSSFNLGKSQIPTLSSMGRSLSSMSNSSQNDSFIRQSNMKPLNSKIPSVETKVPSLIPSAKVSGSAIPSHSSSVSGVFRPTQTLSSVPKLNSASQLHYSICEKSPTVSNNSSNDGMLPHVPKTSYSKIRTPGFVSGISGHGVSPVNKAINTPGIPILPPQPKATQSASGIKLQTSSSGLKRPSSAGSKSSSRLPVPSTNFVSHHRVAAEESTVPENFSAWMHGHQKDASMFPVVIEKNPGVGFSVGAMKHQDRGIYVSNVISGGPASSALKVGDQILQVNGIDITSCDLATVNSLLNTDFPGVNLLISRDH